MYKLIFPSLLALEGSLVLPPHMVKLGHLVVFDEEQGAKHCFEAVRPDLCLLEERQEGSVAIFSPGAGRGPGLARRRKAAGLWG